MDKIKDENMKMLTEILTYYKQLNTKYSFTSKSMIEMCSGVTKDSM